MSSGAADGYHCCKPCFRFINLHDTLHFSLREDAPVRRTTSLRGGEEHDLCVRAARLPATRDTAVHWGGYAVEKRIPMGGGWRGQFGCGDHAGRAEPLMVTWIAACALMQLLAAGADVPVFVFGENAFAEGWRELQAIPGRGVVCGVFPPVHCRPQRFLGASGIDTGCGFNHNARPRKRAIRTATSARSAICGVWTSTGSGALYNLAE